MSENVDSYEGEVVPHEVYMRRRIMAVVVLLLALLLIVGLVSWLVNRGGDSKETTAAAASTSASAEAFSDFSQRATESASADSSDSADADASASADSSTDATAEATDDADAEAEASARAAAEAEASASAEAAASAEAEASASAEPTETAPAVAAACSVADLQVSLTTDRASYGAGQLPALAVTYTNASGNPCVVTGGAGNVDVNITSGPAQVYNYAQCNAVATADAELAAGATNTTALTWNRQLNVLGCNTAATIQPGHYWATASVNGVSSKPVRIIVTG